MSGHLSSDMIQLALQGELPPEQESALHKHLESCSSCAAEMEKISGAEQLADEIPSLLQADGFGDSVPYHEECSTSDFVVEHLEPSDSLEALGQLGDYDVLEVIGRGGMGVVLKGYDRELKRFVAIKALAPHLAHSELARKRFTREAQAAAAVVNSHVIAIHQVQPNGRLPFLVMPLLTGESLAQRLKSKGVLELKEVLRIGMQAADGLAAAHEQGLVHRDVKPANILLEKGVERAVLTDFGLARTADDVSLTRMGVIAGTPEYMSPEQAKGEAVDARSDLFSLGCVLYEIATGVSPFRTETPMATLRRIVDEAPRAMASLNPELPAWFVSLVDRLLAKVPDKRFASARIVSELLAKCLAHVHQPTTEALPKELEMNTATAPRLCWHEMTDDGPRVLWKRVAMLLGGLTSAYWVTAAVMAIGFGVPIRWSTTGWCFWFVCIGLVTSVECERQRAIHGRWRFRLGLNAVLLIAALLGVGVTLMVRDVSSQLEAIRRSADQTRVYPFPNGGHIEGQHASVLYMCNGDRVEYVLFSTDRFASTNDNSGNRERGNISLRNGKSFGFDRQPPDEHLLRINGKEYDLRNGVVFELRDDGSLIQHELFPTVREASSPDDMEHLMNKAAEAKRPPITLAKLKYELRGLQLREKSLLEVLAETHPIIVDARKKREQLELRIKTLVASGQPAEAPLEKSTDDSLTSWGRVNGGLQAGIRLAKEQEHVVSGVALTYEVVVRNTTKNELTVSLQPQWFSSRVKEREIELTAEGVAGSQASDKPLPAGEEMVVGKAFIGLPGSKINAGHLIEVPAGKYRVVTGHVFLTRGESVTDPSKNVGKNPWLETGSLECILQTAQEQGRIWLYDRHERSLLAYSADWNLVEQFAIPETQTLLGLTPDGQQIVYSALAGQKREYFLRKLSKDSTGTAIGLEASPQDGAPLWNRAGNKFIRQQSEDPAKYVGVRSARMQYFLFDLQSKQSKEIQVPDDYWLMGWGPDETTFLAVNNGGDGELVPETGRNGELALLDMNGKNTPINTNGHRVSPHGKMILSPDRQTWIFGGVKIEPTAKHWHHGLFTLEVASGRVWELIHEIDQGYSEGCWSPSGTKLCMLSAFVRDLDTSHGWDELRLNIAEDDGSARRSVTLRERRLGQETDGLSLLGWFNNGPKSDAK